MLAMHQSTRKERNKTAWGNGAETTPPSASAWSAAIFPQPFAKFFFNKNALIRSTSKDKKHCSCLCSIHIFSPSFVVFLSSANEITSNALSDSTDLGIIASFSSRLNWVILIALNNGRPSGSPRSRRPNCPGKGKMADVIKFIFASSRKKHFQADEWRHKRGLLWAATPNENLPQANFPNGVVIPRSTLRQTET